MVSKKIIEQSMSEAITDYWQWLTAKKLGDMYWGVRCGYEERIRYHTYDGFSGSTWKKKSYDVCKIRFTETDNAIVVDVNIPSHRNRTFNRNKFNSALGAHFEMPLIFNYTLVDSP